LDNEENFISGIHNYCDRWCERCGFTARCRVFAMEQEYSDEQRDINTEAFVQNLANIFADAKAMILEKAEEFGFDPFGLSDEEFREIQKRQDSFIDSQDLTMLAERYSVEAGRTLDAKEELLAADPEDEAEAEVIGVLYWYQHFIAAKIQRSLLGMLDVDGFEDSAELNDPQSDANGSAKVALIAIERSLLAWTYVISPKNADRVRPLIELLEKLKHITEEKFPKARDFVRPGFDEIDTVM
jgi:hypothetical protein